MHNSPDCRESSLPLPELAPKPGHGCDRLFCAAGLYWVHTEWGGERMEVYLDLVVILNFLVDFLLLLGTNRLSGFPLSAKRCAVAALLGGLYSGGCMLPGFRFLGSLLWRLVSLGLMSVIAFGCSCSALKRGGVFILLSMALGGIALNFQRGSMVTLILCAGGLWLLCRIAFGDRVGGQEYIPITLTYSGQTASVIALRDSGNTLRDPISGEPVLVVSAKVGQRLTGMGESQFQKPLETLAQHPISGLRLVPYRAVGQNCGMLLALRLEQVKIGDRVQSAVVAFAPEGLDGGYQALVAVG